MMKGLRYLLLLLCALVVMPDIPLTAEAVAATRAYSKHSKKKRSKKNKKGGKKKKSKKRRSKKSYRRSKRIYSPVKQLYMSPDSLQWIRKGRRGIIVSRDSMGVVRAMLPYTCNPRMGDRYADAISEYAVRLAHDSVKVYSLIAPSQGEYYMPALTSTAGAERKAIEMNASRLSPLVTPVLIDDTLRNHLDEEIYNRTDHHWSPLGAYYASKAFAANADVDFMPLDRYRADTIRNYVGTMYKFSGDPEVKKHPEEFVYFMPPEGYRAEFVNYRLSGKGTIGESLPHEEPFFKKYADGSGAAYCTFMGGDPRTVKVTDTGGTPGRRLLIVKDSYGNAMASALFGSFEEVHVVDFRYFPHNLADYVRKNKITDLLFVNCLSLAFAPQTASRLFSMLEKHNAASMHPDEERVEDVEIDEDEEDEEKISESESEEEEVDEETESEETEEEENEEEKNGYEKD